MPGGAVFTVLFFVLASIATVGAMVSIIEVPVAWLTEKGKFGRKAAAAATGAAMLALGVLATLSQGPVLGGVKVFGKNFFDLFDFASSNVLLPLGGLGIAIVAGWLLAKGELGKELGKGYAKLPGSSRAVAALLKFAAPVLILVILLNGLGLFGL